MQLIKNVKVDGKSGVMGMFLGVGQLAICTQWLIASLPPGLSSGMYVSHGLIRPHLLFILNDSIQFWHLPNAGGPPAPVQGHRGSFRGAADVIPPSLEYTQNPTETIESGSVSFDLGRKSLRIFEFIWDPSCLFVISHLVKTSCCCSVCPSRMKNISSIPCCLWYSGSAHQKQMWENVRNSVRRRCQNDKPATGALNQLCLFDLINK